MNRFTRLLTLCLILIGASASGQAPVNDECSGAINVPVNQYANCDGYLTASNINATASPVPGTICTNNTHDVWFKFTAISGGVVIKIPSASMPVGNDSLTLGVAVYSGACGSLNQITCLPDIYKQNTMTASYSSLTVMGLTAGQTYYVRMWTESYIGSPYAAFFDVCIDDFLPPPVNDDCSGALNVNVSPLGNCANMVWTQNISATASAGLGAACTNATHDVWFKFTAISTGINLTIPSANRGYNSILGMGAAVYSGTCGNFLVLGCNTVYQEAYYIPSTPIITPLTITGLNVGQTYYVRIWTQNADVDPYPDYFALCINDLIQIPVNDVASGAIPLTVGAPCTNPIYTNVGATRTPAVWEDGFLDPASAEPFPMCSYEGSSQGQHSVWYSFTAPPSGAVKVTTDNGIIGSLTNTKIALFTINNFSNGGGYHILACDDDNGVNNGAADLLSTMYATGLTPNATYYIEVDGFSASAATGMGTFCLEVHELDSTMLSGSASCTQANPSGLGYDYFSWVSIADDAGKLVALIKSSTGPYVSDYNATCSIDGNGLGTPRQDANGTYYLGRNYMINNAEQIEAEIKFFFRTAELNALTAATGGTVTLSNLNVTRQESSVCHANFLASNGATSVVPRVGSGSVNGVSWIQANPPGLSNFYLMGGTVPLALSLERIDARNEGRSNLVSWTTAKEDKGDYFELERSADGKDFRFLSKVLAKGQSSDYSYRDNSPFTGLNYYRLKMIHTDQKTSYSKVVTATVNDHAAFDLQAYPNPVNSHLTIKIAGNREADAQLTICDVTGRTLKTISVTGATISADMSSFVPGIYLLRYKDKVHSQVIKVARQ